MACLAHRLDAASLLSKIEAYLQSACARASVSELISTVQLAETCHLGALADTCLTLLARQLAAAGPFWREQVSQEQLAECNSESLASLACKMAAQVHAGAFEPPAVHGIQRGGRGAAGAACCLALVGVVPRVGGAAVEANCTQHQQVLLIPA